MGDVLLKNEYPPQKKVKKNEYHYKCHFCSPIWTKIIETKLY